MGPLPYQAVLFDLDGTLIDSYPAITASVNHVRAGRGLSPLPESEVRRHVGRGPAHLLACTVGPNDLEAALVAYRAHHPTVLRAGTRLLPGAADALRALKGAGYQLGVCSNKPVDFTRELVAYLGVANQLDVVLGPEDVAHPKPAPDMLLAALARLRRGPLQVLYVGDMIVDIETARAAGVSVWVVPTGSQTPEALASAGPDHLLRGLADLPGLLGIPGPSA